MNKPTLTLAAASLFFMTSCAPVVNTTVLKSYPPVAPDSVKVYTKKYQVPNNAESLGLVNVRDGGFTTQCDSFTVVSHIKYETGKMGGNAALITEHIKPSFWGSTCHQMTATAMRVQGLSAGKSDSTIIGNLVLGKPTRLLPQARFAANMGYGWRTAKIDPRLSSDERKHVEQLKSGFVWEASAAYFFSDWSGIALEYAGYLATASSVGYLTDMPFVTGTINTTDLMTYIGPAWVVRFSARQTWIWECSIGMGYLGYASNSKIKSYTYKLEGNTIGIKTSIGGEYKFSKNWGLGANMQALSGVLKKMTVTDIYGKTRTEKFEDDQGEGLGQLRMQVGVRYYIK